MTAAQLRSMAKAGASAKELCEAIISFVTSEDTEGTALAARVTAAEVAIDAAEAAIDAVEDDVADHETRIDALEAP